MENWTGQGWVVIDEKTGAAGYMICGGLHGEVINGGSLSEIVDNLFITILKALKKAWVAGDKGAIANTVAIAAAFHLIGALMVYVAGYTAFAVWYLAWSLILVAAAVLIIKLLDNYAWIKRKRYDYAYA